MRLVANELRTKRRRQVVLGPLDATFPVGITCVLGQNGAGKSTLLRMLASARQPDGGSVALVDAEVRRPEYRQQLGYMPQECQFHGSYTIDDLLAYVAAMKNVPRPDVARAIHASLQATDLTHLRLRALRTLSGGELKRAFFAQALVNQPAVLVLDEPTAGLDPLSRSAFVAVVRAAARDRIVIMSTHLADDVSDLANDVLLLAAGSAAFHGTLAAFAATGTSAVGDSGAITAAFRRALTRDN